MSSLLQNTVFGRSKYKPNTFIGGVSNLIPNISTLSSSLQLPLKRIKAFKIIGDDIEFAVIGGGYEIYYGTTIFKNSSLTYYRDPDGLLTYINQDSFLLNTKASEFYFPNLTGCNHHLFSDNSKLIKCHVPKLLTASHSVLFNCPLLTDLNLESLTVANGAELYGSKGLINLNLPNLTSASYYLAMNCTSLKTFNAPKLTKLTDIRNFAYSSSLELINIPNCKQLGANPAIDSNQFLNIKAGCIINIHSSMAIANAGAPDADLVYAINTRGAIVNYI